MCIPILLIWASLTIAAHALLLMRYVVICYGVWKEADGALGLIDILGRAVVGTLLFVPLVVMQWVLIAFFGAMLALGPELAREMQSHVELAFGAARWTFLLPWVATDGNAIVALAATLASFFLLGAATMLPGLGYGSKVVWQAIGLGAYAIYLFVPLAVIQNNYMMGTVVIVGGMLIAGVGMWLFND